MYSRRRDKRMRENAKRQVADADKCKDPTQWVLKNLEEIDDGMSTHPSDSKQYLLVFSSFLTSSFQEWANAMARRPSSVRLSVCKLLRKSLLLAGKWPDRHQTCTRWSPNKHPSRVCSRSRSRSTVTWYAHFLDSWNELLRHWRSG